MPVDGGKVMIFKERKIPRHLIIQEEYELRKRHGTKPFRVVFFLLVVITLTYVAAKGFNTF
jgi:hypothetical protein